MSTMITVSLLMPMSLYGQGGRTDGFFSNNSDGYDNRGEGTTEVTSGISNDPLGAPLGSGLMIMTAAGAGYIIMKKRRRTIKTMFLVAMMLVMTQCKKNPEVVHAENSHVSITLDVSGGSKVDVNTSNGIVTFGDNDEIIVANDGKYVGKLTYDEGVFKGEIATPSSDDYLHFYFLGNVNVDDLEEGSSPGCTINISDQINSLPVISYGHSYEKYSSGIENYEARLQNKCALVKFNVTTSSTFAATCITGMNNQVTVNFADASFTYGMVNDGKITMPSGSGERWAILLPQNEVEQGVDGSAFSGRYKGVRGTVPEIHADDRIDNGVEVVMNTLRQPEGALNGLFTVNSVGKKVVFSRSNLAYVIAEKRWMFFDNQYTAIEFDSQNIGENCCYLTILTSYEWGQTGYNHGAISYIPNHTDTNQDDYYAYGDPACNLYDGNGTADWGYVTISNGENANKQWRTLTKDEWNYIFTYRESASQKYARATIEISSGNIQKGVILLPDDWSAPEGIEFHGGTEYACEDNLYTLSQWASMEEAGAVFLPYAGNRFKFGAYGNNLFCMQWSSSAYNARRAYMISITQTKYQVQRNYGRNNGLPVRLVCE